MVSWDRNIHITSPELVEEIIRIRTDPSVVSIGMLSNQIIHYLASVGNPKGTARRSTALIRLRRGTWIILLLRLRLRRRL